MSAAKAYAKINLGLVVGPLRTDGKHEIVTVLQRVDLHDDIQLEPAPTLAVTGFADDTIVRAALESLADYVGVTPGWAVHIDKRIPVAAGLGGGSSDAAAALELANASLAEPLDRASLHSLAARLGADVPFFLRAGSHFARGDGSELEEILLPMDHAVVLVVPEAETKSATADVYRAFDERDGAAGFDARAAAFLAALEGVASPRDLGALPPNDLASSHLSSELAELGAFRSDVSGAGPTVYGLFEDAEEARTAADALARAGRTFVTRPVAR
ncbi:MAG TPA: hypothetical protein VFU99_12095 [Gaiellaceae bacterium]|nr:hypothetical protein [Gaiellaceae bacterium]